MSKPSNIQRADFVLTTAIALVALLVLGLVFVLGAGSRIYQDANDQRLAGRSVRNAVIEYTLAYTDAVSARRSYLIRGDDDLMEGYRASKERAADMLANLRTLSLAQPEYLEIVERLEARSQELFANLDQGFGSRTVGRLRDSRTAELTEAIERETTALHAAVLARSDINRQNETEARRRIDSVAGFLAALSLIVCGLAILALRRERKQWLLATQAAEEARARAAASDLAKTRFLAVASHDMRQPLHALTLYLSALERRVETQEAKDILAKMDRATQSMVGMFATLLDLARIQAGAVKPEIETVRLQDVIDRIIAGNPGRCIDTRPVTISIDTDPTLLERLIGNLVANALKHGGGAARIEVATADGFVDISVADNGPGIAPEDQERIFEEFVRLEGGGEGLGLGLAIVKRIAGLLKMPLTLDSSPGAGARFTLRAPIAHTQAAEHTAPDEAIDLARAPILVVDDEQLAREAVARMLADLGAETRAAGNEAEAEERLNGFTPRLLVMDLRIDGVLAGVDIAGRLQQKISPQPAVIVVTGDTGPEALSLLRASGYQWLIKPVSPRALGEAAAAQLRSALSVT